MPATVDVAIDRGSARTRVLVVGSDVVEEDSSGVPLDELIQRVTGRPIRRAAIAIAPELSGAEQREVQEELVRAAGTRPGYLVEEPVAAAGAAGYSGDGAIGVVDIGATVVRVSIVVLGSIVVHVRRPLASGTGRTSHAVVADTLDAASAATPGSEIDGLRWVVAGGNADYAVVEQVRAATGRSVELLPDPAHVVVRGVAAALERLG